MCCEIAERAGYEWVWLDTCCIDKTSSAELSEAINSMFFWYLSADICYAYLFDVSDHDDPRERGSSFRRSKYHRRGWTLQELIAPTSVLFLSQAWNTIGSKHSLLEPLVEVTGIDADILLGLEKMTHVSVAGRMSWAAKRETTRVEDRAYSLLGLFGISMPIIYGEGPRAFMRLQQEILKQDPDESLFAWGRIYPSLDAAYDTLQTGLASINVIHVASQESLWDGLLAPNPDVFAQSGKIKQVSGTTMAARLRLPGWHPPIYTFTSHGLHLRLAVSVDHITIRLPQNKEVVEVYVYTAVLACEDEDGYPIVLFLSDGEVHTSWRSPNFEFSHLGLQFGQPRKLYRGARVTSWPGSEEHVENPGLRVTPDVRLFGYTMHRFHPVLYPKYAVREVHVTHKLTNDRLNFSNWLKKACPGKYASAEPRYSFHIPQWVLNRLRSYHGFVQAAPTPYGDGISLVIQTVDQSSRSRASAELFNASTKERLIFSAGRGCTCSSTLHWLGLKVLPLNAVEALSGKKVVSDLDAYGPPAQRAGIDSDDEDEPYIGTSHACRFSQLHSHSARHHIDLTGFEDTPRQIVFAVGEDRAIHIDLTNLDPSSRKAAPIDEHRFSVMVALEGFELDEPYTL
ncbi:hypothetical protein C8Q78DRAFT_998370 [Trametes maxima]|nr:hypothetical protein C8Q78DRAFT_998370 [Trametes maxima]